MHPLPDTLSPLTASLLIRNRFLRNPRMVSSMRALRSLVIIRPLPRPSLTVNPRTRSLRILSPLLRRTIHRILMRRHHQRRCQSLRCL
jgi:hypothetical protein